MRLTQLVGKLAICDFFIAGQAPKLDLSPPWMDRRSIKPLSNVTMKEFRMGLQALDYSYEI